MAILDGALVVPPRIELAYDNPYISPDIDETSLDIWPPHESIVSGGLVNAVLTRTTPVGVTTRVIVGGDSVATSYADDYYYRIHSVPNSVELGNILSEQALDLELWNSYFVDNTLQSIDVVNLSNVTITTGSISIPYTFKPLENVIFGLAIDTTGSAIVDGYIQFTFDTEILRINVTGQRVLLVPFLPSSSFTESLLWSTDVIEAKLGEDRHVVREIPRQDFAYSYRMDQETYSYGLRLFNFLANRPVALPLWSDATKVVQLSAGISTLELDTRYISIEVNTLVSIWSSWDSYELASVISLTADSITLDKVLVNSTTSAWVVPVQVAYSDKGITFNKSKKYVTGTFKATVLDPINLAINDLPNTYLTLPVFDLPNIVSNGLSEQVSRAISTFDSISGKVELSDIQDYTRDRQTISINAVGRKELYDLRRRLDFFQGKLTPFWFPNGSNNVIALAPIYNGNSSLKVKYGSYGLYPLDHIRVTDTSGNSTYFEAISSVATGTLFETFTLSPTPTADILDIQKIDFMVKSRFDSDSITITHHGKGLATMQVSIIEVIS